MKALAASPRCIFGCNCLSCPLPSRKWDFRGHLMDLAREHRGAFVVTSWDFRGHIVDLGRSSEGTGTVLRSHRLRHRRTRRGHVAIRRKAPRLRGLELGAPAR
jgi:hypothetical protein